jgi:hypothetical protein
MLPCKRPHTGQEKKKKKRRLIMVEFDWSGHLEEFNSWLKEKELFDTYWKPKRFEEKNANLIRLTFIRGVHPEIYEKQVSDMRERLRLRNWELKKKFADLLGGKCQECGFDKNLVSFQFHHKDPRDKWSKSTGSGYNEDPERFEKDILAGKIELLCANCHWYKESFLPKIHRSTFKYRQIRKE